MRAATSASTRSRNRSFASRSGEMSRMSTAPPARRLLHAVPLFLVVRVDRLRVDAHPLGRGDLVAHERQQGADEEGRPETRLAQQPGRDEVDEALPPARLLYHELSAAAFDEVTDGFFLPLAEPGVLPPRAPLQEVQGSERVVLHVGGGVGIGGRRRRAARAGTPLNGMRPAYHGASFGERRVR